VAVTQTGCLLSIASPFGADVLLLDGFGGHEAISAPFRFNLRMRSTNPALDPQTIIGQNATVTVEGAAATPRYFNGIVTRFAQVGASAQYGYYSAELAPRLWLLSLGSDRAIFQNMDALAIVQKVLSSFSIVVEARVTGSYAVREYCVQYDESALQFISRLMEEEGMFYFFTFANGAHTMVLADSPSAHQPGAVPTLRFSGDSVGHDASERVSSFEMSTGLVAATYVVGDYDYKSASTLSAQTSAQTHGASGIRYAFPGRYAAAADGERAATLQLAAQQMDQQTGRATSACYALTAGTQVSLAGHANSAFNVSYVVRRVEHRAADGQYDNDVDVFPSAVAFRAPRATPCPVVAGTHTAIVTGSSGEEIWTDSLGRIKVKFHWDRVSAADENSSCWVRVAQASAGAGWGHLFLPRVGQEVVVSYVDGDPDRPLVTGSVYNGQMSPPVGLPGSQTQSVMRSRSSKSGTAGNEIRMEDKLNSEELYFHAQKDMNVAIENALSTTVIAGDETHLVKKGNRTLTVETGNETHTVKGTRAVDVTGDETHTSHATFKHTTTGDYTLKISGNLVIDVSGSISIKAGTSLASQAGTSLTSQAGTTLGNKAGTTLSNEGVEIQSKASAMQTVDGGAMLTLKGGLIKAN
jgi:type VI secretion system secreted protein VgrG